MNTPKESLWGISNGFNRRLKNEIAQNFVPFADVAYVL